jgi:O-glycosyl hydrolase
MKNHFLSSLSCALFLALIGANPRIAPAADVTINWNDTRQEITGFGSGWENELGAFAMALPQAVRTQMMTMLFDSVQGIGLTYVRTHMPPDLLDASGNWNWNSTSGRVAGKAMDQVTLMQESQKAGATKFWAAPWAAVPMYKANPVYGEGGPILRSHYQDYANYMSRFIREYKTRFGIPFMGISVQNEPQGDFSYGGCPWTGADIRDYIRDYLGPTLLRDSVDISIIAPESNWDETEYIDPAMSDANALKYIDVVAFHDYTGSPFRYAKALDQGKPVWLSECSNSGRDDGWSSAGWYAHRIWNHLVNAETSSWQYWWFYDGFKDNSGFIGPYENGSLVIKRLYYWIGHYSKFVRPGYRRITTTPSFIMDSGNRQIGVSAFKNPSTGRFAIVLNNWSLDKPAKSITYHFNGVAPASVTPYLSTGENENQNMEKQADIPVVNGAFTYTVPNVSIATFVGAGTPTPVVNKRTEQPVSRQTSAFAVKDGIRLRMQSPAAGRAVLIDPAGKTIAQCAVTALPEQVLPVLSLMAGQVYVLRLTCANRTEAIKLFN